jgi:hypothetical protein
VNQFAMHNSIDDLLAEIDAHFGWMPSDFNIDVSSRHWYHSSGGRKAAREAKLVRKIQKELLRLRDLDNE